jgi:hypothetical protein
MFWSNWNKKAEEPPKVEVNSAEYRKLAVRLSQIEADILGLAVAQDVIRNKVMKKIRLKDKDSSENDEDYDNWGGIPIQ